MMDNKILLNQMTKSNNAEAFKSMRNDMESGKALLNPEQLATFLRAMSLPNVILNSADFKLMKSFELNLSRVDIEGRVLGNGYTADGETKTVDPANVKFGANTLRAKKLKAMCEIEDDEVEDNLEEMQFIETLLTLMGERIGEDVQFWTLFSDTNIEYKTNELLSSTDGWLKLAQQQLVSEGVQTAKGTSSGTTEKADYSLTDGVEVMFDKLIQSIPARFRQQRNQLAFYVPYEVDDAYRNILKARGTVLGDVSQTGYNALSYKGIPIIHCVTLDAEDGRAIDNTASVLLTNPKNMAYGVWKNVSIEPERKAEVEKTKYWYRLRADCDYYFRQGASVAKMTLDEVNALPKASTQL